MSNETDPYELNDDPFADDAADDLPEGEAIEPGSDLDELAAAAQARPRAGGSEFAPRLGSDGRLDEDIHCRDCGYNLRGQSLEGSCPECGTPVERSLASDHLRFANDDWLRSLYTGASFLAIGTLCLIPLSCVIGGIGSAFSGLSPSPSGFGSGLNSSAMLAEGISSLLSAIAGLIVSGYGTWKLCQPEPGAILGTPSDSAARAIARWTVLPANAISVFIAFFYFVPVAEVLMVAGVIDALTAIPALVGFVASLIYLRKLALRVPDESLASQTRIVMWGIIGTVTLGIPAMLVIVLLAVGGSSPAIAPIAACACFLGVGLLVFGIWWLVIMFRFRSVFAYAMSRSSRGY